MKQLTQKEARAIFAPLAHAQWLTAGRMLMPSGVHKERMGSLREVYWFLEPSSRSLPAIDFDRLANWLETALEDKQTAEQVRNVSATFTVVDGGEGLASDSIIVNDGIREYPVRLLDGVITISTGKKQEN